MPRTLEPAPLPTRMPPDVPNLSLPLLLGRLSAGEPAALGELFVSYGDEVYRAALRLTASRADAEDVTQEVFLRLRALAGSFSGPPASFAAWLRRVAIRQALMHLRGGQRRREVTVDGVANLVAPAHAPLDRLSIEWALATLPGDLRTAFLLKEVEGLSHAEIAELLDISIANSEVRLHRARRRLRDLLRGSR